LVALVIWLQDPSRRRRLADWAAGLALTGLAVILAKTLIGRPRPKFDDPGYFLGPFGQYPINPRVGVRHAWEIGSGISSDLWSMPSSHTAYVVVMAVFISAVYPKLRIIVWPIAAIVGLGRIITGAHYPTDVIAGAAIGLAAGGTAIKGRWGQALLDRLARPGPPHAIAAPSPLLTPDSAAPATPTPLQAASAAAHRDQSG
jgi:membrane-associated phospholipid phosphatase